MARCTRAPHVVHELPRRIRFKGGVLRHGMLNFNYLEAHLATLPGVERVRCNPLAASVAIRHDGLPGRKAAFLAVLNAPPRAAFAPAAPRLRQLSALDLGLHAVVAAAGFAAPPLVATFLAILVGLPVIVDGIKHLITRGFTAKSLDAVSVGLCLVLGNYAAVCVIALMRVFGDYLHQTGDRRSTELLHGLLRLRRMTAWVERDGVEIELPCEAVAIGDVVVCGPGDMITVDGRILSGAAMVNKSMINGESLPVSLEPGDAAISGSVVESGRIRIQAGKVGGETTMAVIDRYLENALQDRSLPELKGDALADRLAPVTLGLGIGAFALTHDLARTASVASIDYVCSVKFPARLSVRSSMCAAAKAGILLKGGRALDALARVNAVVFDKTGTLTTRELRVTDVIPFEGWSRDQLLGLAARLEQHYDHPVARSILTEAKCAGLQLTPVGEVDFFVSHGICAVVDGRRSQVGSRRFITHVKGLTCGHADALAENLRAQGKMVLYVAQSNVVRGLIAMRDETRPHAQAAINGLRQLGVSKIVVLTGDHSTTAQRFTDRLEGLDAVHWELTPEDKARVVGELRAEGHCVAVVGDGVNDAPAMVCADLGICMAHGGDLARASAQAVILNDDLLSLCAARRIAQRQHQILDHCLHEGAAANTLLLALAATGVLSPVAAAMLHNTNTFCLMAYATAKAGAACDVER